MVGPIIQTSAKSSDFEALFFSEVDGFFLTCPCHKIKKKQQQQKSLERSIVALVMRYDTNGVKWTHRSKEKKTVANVANVANPGEGPEDPLPPFIFRPNNWGLTGSLAPLSQGLDDRRLAPHPLHFPLSEGLDVPLKSNCRSSALHKVTESFL